MVYWNELGFFVDIIAQSQLAMRTVNSIITNLEEDDKTKYYPELLADGQGEEPVTWNLTLLEKPYQYFYELSSKDKRHVAGNLDFRLLIIQNWFFNDDEV